MEPTENQRKLYQEISNYIYSTLIGVYNVVTEKHKDINNDTVMLQMVMIPLLQDYFNHNAFDVQSGKDARINIMINIDVGQKFHAMDLYQMIVMLTMNALKSSSGVDFEDSIKRFLCKTSPIAANFRGCQDDHEVTLLKPDDKLFIFDVRPIEY